MRGPTKIAQSEERGPRHSEQWTWCTSWNEGQTEGTTRAHESCPWAGTKKILGLIGISFHAFYQQGHTPLW